MLTVQDEQTLGRLVGGEIPEDLRQECEMRTRMFHSAGHSGPLGAVGLIDAVRSLGYKPPHVEPPVPKVNWRLYPQDGSTRVEAKFFGQWMRGRFLGFVESGILAVRLDDDEVVKECRPDMVRLVETEETSEEGPDARIELIDAVADTAEMPAVSGVPDLINLQPGDTLWIEEGDEVKDASFLSVEEDGGCIALVEGEEESRKIPAGSWTVAGA